MKLTLTARLFGGFGLVLLVLAALMFFALRAADDLP